MNVTEKKKTIGVCNSGKDFKDYNICRPPGPTAHCGWQIKKKKGIG
jgi:hypothetical protein